MTMWWSRPISSRVDSPTTTPTRAPKLIRKESGIDVWAFEGQELPNIGLNAVAGRPPEEYAMDPQSFDDMRPGCYDIHDRVKDMNANGLLGSMCFPSFPQFCGQLFTRTAKHDEAFAEALVAARTTTGTSSRGAARTPAASSRCRSR